MGNIIISGLKQIDESVEITGMKPKNLVFEERVKLSCFNCKHYDNSWCCPPRLPNIDYKKIMSEYDSGAFVVLKTPLDAARDGNRKLHQILLNMEQHLWEKNKPLATSFKAGPCKLCEVCNDIKCVKPNLSRTSLEAIGINVVTSAAQYGIDLKFPPEKEISNTGLIVW